MASIFDVCVMGVSGSLLDDFFQCGPSVYLVQSNFMVPDSVLPHAAMQRPGIGDQRDLKRQKTAAIALLGRDCGYD